MASKFFRVKQIRSELGRYPKHIRTIQALGFRHPQDTVELPDTPQVRGMIYSVQFLLEVTVVSGALEKKPNPKRQKRREAKKAQVAAARAPKTAVPAVRTLKTAAKKTA